MHYDTLLKKGSVHMHSKSTSFIEPLLAAFFFKLKACDKGKQY